MVARPSMKCYRKNGSDVARRDAASLSGGPSMKCYRKNVSDVRIDTRISERVVPSMKCYRKNGSDSASRRTNRSTIFPQ